MKRQTLRRIKNIAVLINKIKYGKNEPIVRMLWSIIKNTSKKKYEE